eukprot:1719275-Pyramimonas_sp.AAC.1
MGAGKEGKRKGGRGCLVCVLADCGQGLGVLRDRPASALARELWRKKPCALAAQPTHAVNLRLSKCARRKI